MAIDIVDPIPANDANIKKVIEAVSAVTGVREADIMRKSRLREHVAARNMCFSVLRMGLGMTFMTIAAYFEKHHATVIHAVKINEFDMDTNVAYRSRFETILSQLGVRYAEKITHGDVIETIVKDLFRRQPIVID